MGDALPSNLDGSAVPGPDLPGLDEPGVLLPDDDGIALLGRVPFDTDGDFGRIDFNTSVGIVRVAHGGRVGYAFLDSTLLNLAYWRGETGVYVRDFPVPLH